MSTFEEERKVWGQKMMELLDDAEMDARSWKMKFEILEASMRRIMNLVQDVEGGRDVQKEIEHALLSCGVGDKCE